MAINGDAGGADQHRVVLVRRLQHLDGTAISSSRPITGSSLPSSARSSQIVVCFSSAWRFSSALASSIFLPPRTLSMAASNFSLALTLGAQQLPQVALLVEGCQHEQLGRDELILALLGQLVTDD